MSPGQARHLAFRAGFIVAALALSILIRPFGTSLFAAVGLATLLALTAIALEVRLRRVDTGTLIGHSLGLLAGLSLGVLTVSLFGPLLPPASAQFFRLACPLVTSFWGLSLGAAKAGSLRVSFTPQSSPAPVVLRYLDSSALVDGRIVALAEAGFLDGDFVIPQFVLNELQMVADTADTLRRNRGRRGLDSVALLRKIVGIRLEISPVDYAAVREVDLKLIEAARARQAQIITTDSNLGKLAAAQGIRVLNVNELASVLRPAVLQGETLRVSVAKEGKEPAQGLAYLEDGTMVVVENAGRQIGKTIDIVVTGVVQSVTGKMIFGRYQDMRTARRNRTAS